MAYNIFAETNRKIKWEELNKRLVMNRLLEYVPMPGMGIDGGDALGISIPSKNIRNETWAELKMAIEILGNEFQLDLYDMYYGEKIDSKFMVKLKENLFV